MITNFSSFNHAISKVKSFQTTGMNAINFATFFQLVFGASASQTVALLRIRKSGLIGTSATTGNSAQSLFVALLLRMMVFNVSIHNKLHVYKWGTSITNDILTHTIIIDLFNQLIIEEQQQLTEINATVKPGDY